MVKTVVELLHHRVAAYIYDASLNFDDIIELYCNIKSTLWVHIYY